MSSSSTEPQVSETTASNAEKQPKPKGWFRRAILLRIKVFAVFFVFYTLSIGPMFWTWYQSKYLSGSPWVALFYEPLLLLTSIPWFRDLINWWVDWWIL
jgi:hypothetical protein